MSIKINSLIFSFLLSLTNTSSASNYFIISEDGLQTPDGKIINHEISTKPITYSYSLREQAGNEITLYRDTHLNSSNEQCSIQFKKNNSNEYIGLSSICFDEIISIKEKNKSPALKFVNLNNVKLSKYHDTMTTNGEYIFAKKTLSDVALFDMNKDNKKNEPYCNYYIKDYLIGIKTEKIRCYKSTTIKNKAFLYNLPNFDSKSKKYLISGDKIIPLDKKIDNQGNNWIYILYQGKKDITMWINSNSLL